MKNLIIKILIAILNNPVISKAIADVVVKEIELDHPLRKYCRR